MSSRRPHSSSVIPLGLSSLVLACFLWPAAVAAQEIDYADFSSTTGLQLVGNAFTDSTVLYLTPELEYQAGAVWFATQLDLSNGFSTTFTFRIPPAVEPSEEVACSIDEEPYPGDGIAFVIQSAAVDALGGGGYGIGYGDGETAPATTVPGITNSLAVELDTWQNPILGDGTVDHAAVHSNGAGANDGSSTSLIGPDAPIGVDINDGSTHTAQIDFDGSTLEIRVDGSLVSTVDVSSALASGDGVLSSGGEAWVGFTSGTGLCYQTHELHSWTLALVSLPTDIFSSGFETGDFTGWSAVVGGIGG